MVINLPNNSLSQDEEEALAIIYERYLLQKSTNPSDSYYYKIFEVISLFPDYNNNDIMPTLIKLSIKRIIRLFSDKRLMVNEKAIPYIEKRLKKGLKNQT